MSDLVTDCIPWFVCITWDHCLTESPHRAACADMARQHNAPSPLFVPGRVICVVQGQIKFYLNVETARIFAVGGQLATARLCHDVPKRLVQATRFPCTHVPRTAADPATRATRITSPRLPIVRQPRSPRPVAAAGETVTVRTPRETSPHRSPSIKAADRSDDGT